MRRWKDEPAAVRVYTVCDESRYLIVRNVPALRCIDELVKLFGSYGEISEILDEEEREQFTEVCWIKFSQVGNARFAKRKLDEYVFYGNRLQVSYAPQYEILSDTKEKLEIRRREVLSRLHCGFLTYFPLASMNETVQLVREKLDKIQSTGTEHCSHPEAGSSMKKAKVDNRRRI
ncbi:RNA-binding protein 48 [Nymphaea thermarum]|nr:RNA-binding protein 48 [Nymphaea thermarum]